MKPAPKLTRVSKRLFYRLVHSRAEPHLVTARCCGLTFRYSSASGIGEAIFANAFERTERLILDRLIRPGMTVLDVGANLGFYTCLFAQKVGRKGRVLSFEPTPSTFETLARNVQNNGLQNTVECHQLALSDTEGTTSMYTYPMGRDAHNSLAISSYSDRCTAESQTEVKTSRMDKYLMNVDRSVGCFIKIDVEGFEHQVVSGAVSQLSRLENLSLMVELHEPTARQCNSSVLTTLGTLERLGLDAYCIGQAGRLRRMDSNVRDDLLTARVSPNVFFFRAGRCPVAIEEAHLHVPAA